MKRVVIIYWSASGNTEAMAKAVAEGAAGAGAAVDLKPVGEAGAALLKSADALAFGCPAMGDEVLEESEMEPFISSLSGADLRGKPLGLFGSYDWGDGRWMRDWAERMRGLGAAVDERTVIAQLEPDAVATASCRALGVRLAG
jgi:flavodoxin short chain